jgi:prevent-host-death family protein
VAKTSKDSRKAASARRQRKSRGPTWPAQEARAHFSDVIDAAIKGVPQRITRNGKNVVTVIRSEDLRPSAPKAVNLLELFQNSPLTDLLDEVGEIDGSFRDDEPLPQPTDLGDDE